jgi:glucose/arabinose dehydrogenase
LDVEIIGEDFDQPVYVTSPAGDPRLFVVERAGTIRIVDPASGKLEQPLLDIRAEVHDPGIEQGLLGMAFHPDFADTGRFFVYYTDSDNDTQLVEYRKNPNENTADPLTARRLLLFPQPTDRHNGGMLLFGPDGYLYLGLGEGGKASLHAQHPETLLSAILRIDVDDGDPYGIPPNNPFIEGEGAPEVLVYGLRNPWRFAIDDGLLYIADVGHSDWEEINVVPLDGIPYNFGWLIMEGNHCFIPTDCDPTGLTLPVLEYGHDQGCSITGGFVYRGAAIPELNGHYFYADWCTRFVRSFRYEGGVAADQQDWSDDLAEVGQINSFGLDADGELYVATWSGTVARIIARR